MTLLDRILLRQLLAAFAFLLIALAVLFVMIDSLTHQRNAILDNEVPGIVVAQYYAALLPRLFSDYHVAGFAMLVAVLSVVGSWAQRDELTAALAAGVSLARFATGPFLLATAISISLFTLSDQVGPSAARQALAIEREYLGRPGNAPEMNREPVSWANLSGDWTCHVTKFNRVAMTGEEVLMLAARDGTEEQIRANRMFWDGETRTWIFEDGMWAVFYPDQGAMPVSKRRITRERAPIAESPDELFAPMEEPAMRSLRDLQTVIRSARDRGVPVERLEVEWHARIARSAMPLVMLCIAVPLAARIRKRGRAAGIALAVGLGVAYSILYGTTQSLAINGRLDPRIAVWFTNALFLIFGFTLFRRTPR